MATEGAGRSGYVVPNPQVAKTLGILNIIFACLLLACSMFNALSMATMPLLNKAIQAQKQEMKQAEAKTKAKLDDLDKQEKAAKTEAEKQEVASQRATLTGRSKSTVGFNFSMDFNAMGLNDPRYLTYWYADTLTGLVMNVIMLASGIGLLMVKPWARTTWLWAAAIKIIRLILVWGYFAVAVVPGLSQRLGKFIYNMMAQQQAGGRPGGPPGMSEEFFTRLYGITYTGMAAGMILFGMIYPVVSIWLLNKPRVKAAFLPKPARTPGPRSELELS
ncbi:MAG TPA: hypothetical protein VGZ22_31845 [Isosphaeraceae bacterium]|nr:hypothetical protein [Isosphaeraceae bacterium]